MDVTRVTSVCTMVSMFWLDFALISLIFAVVAASSSAPFVPSSAG